MDARTGYYDFHCHILPEVDDGSRSMEMSLEMIRMEYEQGVRHILLTPHCAAGYCDGGRLRRQYEELKGKAAELYPDLELLPGSELMYSDSILEELAAGNALTLAQTDYVLVEFDIGIAWDKMQRAFRRLAEAGYRPILAHMERFLCLDRAPDRIDELISQGVCMQMNSSSVTGGVFDRQAGSCRKLVNSGRIHLLGTDAHQTDWRPPDLGRAVQDLERKIKDKALLEKILFRNPAEILANAYIG